MVAIDRRRFLTSTGALAALAGLRPRLSSAAHAPGKAVLVTKLPDELPLLDRFRLAADVGFAGVEMQTVEDPAEAEQAGEAAERLGLRIHSVVSTAQRRHPLSSADPGVVRRSVAGLAASLGNAKLWGADAVRLAPAAVDPQTSYRDAWNRSQNVIRERILPLARELDVVVAVERVSNGPLFGPLELARYVDALDSPWVKASFDTGHIVFYAYPQDWIRALGRRIAKVHLRIGQEDVDWGEVRRALREIGYDGWMTAEPAGGDAASLRDAATRLDRVLGG
jgi:hexulose-6-phosphate isomerase